MLICAASDPAVKVCVLPACRLHPCSHAVEVTLRSGVIKTVYSSIFNHHCQRVARMIREFSDTDISEEDIQDAAFDTSFDRPVDSPVNGAMA